MRIKIKDKKNFIEMFNELFIANKIDTINALTIDSRKVNKNDIYIPIKGNKYDGHDFINSSLNSGALLCFSENNQQKNIIKTKSTIKLIEDLAVEWKKKSKAKIIGITGSNGKTTTKELLHSILSKKYNCSKSIGNYNSKIGLPLAFLNSNIDDDYCILEYGASRPNEIDYLCKILKPNYSLITNISNSHIENFHSQKEIVTTKNAIYENLNKNDIGFVNNDNSYTKKLVFNSNKITFGFNNKSDYLCKIKNINNKKILSINNNDLKIPDRLYHLKENILSTYSIANYLNVDLKDICKSINSFNLPKGRGNEIKFNNIKLIDDSYNANPKSVQLAIKRINKIKNEGKKIFVFADMLELGEKSILEHEAISQFINKSKINVLLTFGNLSLFTSKKVFTKNIYKKHYTNLSDLKNDLKKISNTKDLIYLKASRSMKLEKIYSKK